MDDNQSSAEAIARHLRSRSHRVAIAATGHDGLLQVQRQAVDVVVLDYNLPDIDGIQWLRAMRALTLARRPGVLIFTADWEVADEAEEIQKLGALFASKLCDIEELDRLSASLISMQRQLAQNASAIPSTTN